MVKIFKFFIILVVLFFFFNVYIYYSSNKNIKNVNLNRSKINEILKEKTLNIPILEDNTNNVIEFNSSFSEEIQNNKPRNFWNLFKFK